MRKILLFILFTISGLVVSSQSFIHFKVGAGVDFFHSKNKDIKFFPQENLSIGFGYKLLLKNRFSLINDFEVKRSDIRYQYYLDSDQDIQLVQTYNMYSTSIGVGYKVSIKKRILLPYLSVGITVSKFAHDGVAGNFSITFPLLESIPQKTTSYPFVKIGTHYLAKFRKKDRLYYSLGASYTYTFVNAFENSITTSYIYQNNEKQWVGKFSYFSFDIGLAVLLGKI